MHDYLDQLAFLFLKNLNEECGGECNAPNEMEMFVRIKINSLSLKLYSDTDESYRLNITSNSKRVMATISAETAFGARHGLETLSQLMVKRIDSGKRNGLVIVSSAFVSDKPSYQHRGLLLDTARHFIPIATVLRILDGMSANKLNVFHWHITDSQSFPMESKRLPQMNFYGAFAEDKVYRTSEIESIIKYAKYRGIRVIIELDSPAHAGHGYQWGPDFGLGNLAVCVDSQPWRKSCIQPNCGQLNPANPNIYSVLRDLFQDIHDFNGIDELFHLGGDEVFINCWNSTGEITDYMKTKNYDRTHRGFLQLWAEFQWKALNVWDDVTGNRNDSIILWSSELTSPEHIEEFLPKDRYIVQTWLADNDTIPKQLISKCISKLFYIFKFGLTGRFCRLSGYHVYKERLVLRSRLLGRHQILQLENGLQQSPSKEYSCAWGRR